MAGLIYSVQLHIGVNDTQLDTAIAKLTKLRRMAAQPIVVGARGGGVSGGGAATSRATSTPFRGQFTRDDAFVRRSPFWGKYFTENGIRFDKAGLSLGRRNFAGAWGTYNKEAFKNMFSISGFGRNISNLGNVFGSLGGVVGKTIPLIGALGSVAKLAAQAWAIIKVVQIAKGGIPYWIGTKAINSEMLGTAGANIMQMGVSQNILGDKGYKEAWASATKMSTEYGFSRSAMLGTMSMLRGLKVGDRALGMKDAEMISRALGKIAQAGSVPFERAAINMQQILGAATKPRTRDIQEIVHGTPAFGTVVRNMMSRDKNAGSDIVEWLQDKSNMVKALAKFDQMVASNPIMQMRGQLKLNKENFGIRMVQDTGVQTFLNSVTVAHGQILDSIGDKISAFLKNLSAADWSELFDKFYQGCIDLTDAFIGLARIINLIVDLFGLAPGLFTLLNIGKRSMRVPRPTLSEEGGALYTTTAYPELGEDDKPQPLSEMAAAKLQAKKVAIVKWLKQNPKEARELQKQGVRGSDLVNSTALKLGSATPVLWDKSTSAGRLITNMTAQQYYFDYEAFKGAQKTGAGNGVATDTNDIADLSKGSRALIINFNKEIVSMPVNIEGVASIDEAWQTRLQQRVEDTVVRGLQISLNNATAAG